jgi:erythromycin esterase-like protein
MRDSIMADNLFWALEQEGSRERLLLLAHNAHVFADRATLGPPLAQEPLTLGQRFATRWVMPTSSSARKPERWATM